MALIRPLPLSEDNIAIDSVYLDSDNYWYPTRVDSDGTIATPGRVSSMPTSGEFWSISDTNMVATKACHITGYKIYLGASSWDSVDVTCAVGDTIMSTRSLVGYMMRAEL